MSRREDIDNAIWGDPDFDGLSNEAALLYLWSFTNPSCGMAGIYKIAKRKILEGRLGDKLDQALDELAEAGFVFYEDGVFWVRSRVKHLRTKGEQMKRSIELDLEKLPEGHPLTERFREEYEGTWIASVVEGFDRGSGGVQENGSGERKSRTPAGPPEGSQGKGKGKGRGKGLEEPPTSQVSKDVVRKLFDFWVERLGKHQPKFSDKRKRVLRARLAEGFTERELGEAIAGVVHSPHHMGENDSGPKGEGKRFDDLTLICRDPEKVEEFRDLYRQVKGNGDRREQAFDRFLRKEVPA